MKKRRNVLRITKKEWKILVGLCGLLPFNILIHMGMNQVGIVDYVFLEILCVSLLITGAAMITVAVIIGVNKRKLIYLELLRLLAKFRQHYKLSPVIKED